MISIELIVPYVIHGGTGQRARLLATHLERELGQRVSPVSKTDAVAGHAAVAQAKPDGSTLGMITGEIGMMHWNPGLTDLTWRAYTPLAVPYVEPSGILVRPDSPYQTLGDLLDAARRRPLKGSGSPHYGVWKFSLVGLFDAAGIDVRRLIWVPTLSGEEGAEKLLTGEVDVAPVAITEARTFVLAGKLKALANMDAVRHPMFPEVPTVKEAVGIDWRVAHWRGLVAPAGLPDALKQGFVEALRRISNRQDFAEECRANGFGTGWRFDADFLEYMKQDDEQFGRIIRMLQKLGT